MRMLAPSNPRDRFEIYRFFNGLSSEAKEGLDQRRTRVPLVKTFLLEHVACRGNGRPKPPARIFENLGAEVQPIDDRFMGLSFELSDPVAITRSRATTGFLEQYDERFFAYYTCEESVEAKKRVAKWVQAPDLNYTWFSSPLLQVLWDKDVSNTVSSGVRSTLLTDIIHKKVGPVLKRSGKGKAHGVKLKAESSRFKAQCFQTL